jgi:cytochrome c peroxidase
LQTTGVRIVLVAATTAIGCTAKHEPATAPEPAVKTATQPVREPPPAPRDEIDPKVLKRFLPSAAANPMAAPDPAKVALGRAIFFDKRLSPDGQTACGTCHALDRAAQGGGTSGTAGQRCVRGASTGSKTTSPDQRTVVATMQRIQGYADLFATAFPHERRPMALKNVAEVIAEFERGLETKSRWDRYVLGESGALTAAEKKGLKAFLDAGCQSCHTGPDLGGTMFQKLGAVIPWPDQTSPKGVKSPSPDKPVKVPSLRVATVYARYFRDGTGSKLRESIQKMGYHQLGIQLSDEDIDAIAVWMQSLTGELDPVYVAAPQSPPGTKIANLH